MKGIAGWGRKLLFTPQILKVLLGALCAFWLRLLLKVLTKLFSFPLISINKIQSVVPRAP